MSIPTTTRLNPEPASISVLPESFIMQKVLGYVQDDAVLIPVVDFFESDKYGDEFQKVRNDTFNDVLDKMISLVNEPCEGDTDKGHRIFSIGLKALAKHPKEKLLAVDDPEARAQYTLDFIAQADAVMPMLQDEIEKNSHRKESKALVALNEEDAKYWNDGLMLAPPGIHASLSQRRVPAATTYAMETALVDTALVDSMFRLENELPQQVHAPLQVTNELALVKEPLWYETLMRRFRKELAIEQKDADEEVILSLEKDLRNVLSEKHQCDCEIEQQQAELKKALHKFERLKHKIEQLKQKSKGLQEVVDELRSKYEQLLQERRLRHVDEH